MSKIIGIDLGTTNCCVAVLEGGEPKVIENTEGGRTTPSVVAYTDDQLLVGQSAKRQAVTNPESTLFAIKRLIGRRFEDEVVKRDMDMVPYKIVPSDNGDAWLGVKDKKLAPAEVSAQLLIKMKKTAEDYLGESVTEAVVTVPAYFDDSQRKATRDAGRIAGLDVKRIINEPTAAALSYGFQEGKMEQKIAVYDLGGGTFDISIIEAVMVDGEKQFEVLATNGDTFLGGEDFDKRLIDYLLAEFKKDEGLDLQGDPLALQRLKEAAEKAKIELSTSTQTEINLPFITADATGPKHLVRKISRAKMETLSENLVEKSLKPVATALDDANLTADEIDAILLVGGQTRMPLVQEKVKAFFGKAPRHGVNPDESVALGAAVQAGILMGDVKDMLLLDVTPLSLGIETMGGVLTPLIEKNTTIPTQRSQTFSTAEDNQSAVTIHICQGERKQVVNNKSLGRFDLTDIDPAPRGTPQIEVSFDIDSNGILEVTAKNKVTGKQQSIKINNSGGLSEAEIERMVKDAEDNVEADRKFEQLVQQRNSAELLVHATRKMMTELGGDKLEDEQRSGIEEALKEVENSLQGEDQQAIEEAIRKLTEASAVLGQLAAEQQATDAAGSDQPAADSEDGEQSVDVDFEEVSDSPSKPKDSES